LVVAADPAGPGLRRAGDRVGVGPLDAELLLLRKRRGERRGRGDRRGLDARLPADPLERVARELLAAAGGRLAEVGRLQAQDVGEVEPRVDRIEPVEAAG